MPNEETETAKNLLIKMYLELKLRKKEELDSLTNEKLKEEKQNLERFSLIELINYISSTINILIELQANTKYEEKKNKEKEIEKEEEKDENSGKEEKKSLAKQYEELLIKAESDIRKHIKVRKYI